jgi:MinD-like ATPase involved in chromosome partitioning or flagellar assembly
VRRPRARSRLKRAFTATGERAEADLDARLRGVRRVSRPLTVAFVGAKGGVGRTLCTAGVGALLAERTSLRVLAVDVSRGRGTLSLILRQSRRSKLGAVGLLEVLDEVSSATSLRTFMSSHASGLDVLAGPVPPDQLRPLVFVCQRFYDVLLLDTSGELGSRRVEAALSCSRGVVAVTTPERPAVMLTAQGLAPMSTVVGVVLNRVSDHVPAEPGRAVLERRVRRPVWPLREDPELAQMVNSGALGLAALPSETRIDLLEIATGLLDGLKPARAR